MTIYWLLFAFPALMALAYPVKDGFAPNSSGQRLAFLAFILFYAAIAGLRYETGGDWLTYDEMFEDMRVDTLSYALSRTDPIYGFLNWASAQLGTGIFLVNFICGLVLATGVVRTASRLREPWLAILIAVPYLMIVVGMGYVRQGAAIGMIMIALGSLDRSKPFQTVAYLVLAVGFHSTAAIAFPLFGVALTRKRKVLAVVMGLIGALAFIYVILPRIGLFELGYIDQEYDSGGATTRVLMSFIPSVLVLARRKAMFSSDTSRSVWVMFALANIAALFALVLSPSSTAVDRLALFFSVIQLAAFGEMRPLAGIGPRTVLLARAFLILIAAAVQSVWLIFGTHAIFWVPYRSVFELL